MQAESVVVFEKRFVFGNDTIVISSRSTQSECTPDSRLSRQAHNALFRTGSAPVITGHRHRGSPLRCPPGRERHASVAVAISEVEQIGVYPNANFVLGLGVQ